MPTLPPPKPDIDWHPYGSNLPSGYSLSAHPENTNDKQPLIFIHELGRNHSDGRQKDCNAIVAELQNRKGLERFDVYALDYPSSKVPDLVQRWTAVQDPGLAEASKKAADIFQEGFQGRGALVLAGISQGSLLARNAAALLNERRASGLDAPEIDDILNIAGPHRGAAAAAGWARLAAGFETPAFKVWGFDIPKFKVPGFTIKQQVIDVAPASNYLLHLDEHLHAQPSKRMHHVFDPHDEVVPPPSSLGTPAKNHLLIAADEEKTSALTPGGERLQTSDFPNTVSEFRERSHFLTMNVPEPKAGRHMEIVTRGAPAIADLIMKKTGASAERGRYDAALPPSSPRSGGVVQR